MVMGIDFTGLDGPILETLAAVAVTIVVVGLVLLFP
jgi:hypothetical protein